MAFIKCRLCGYDSYDKTRFTSLVNSNDSNNFLLFKIKNVLNIIVQKEDPLPKYICNACREQIESIEKFKQLCEQTQILLWKQYILTGDCLDKSIRKKRHETQHSGIEENHQVKLLLNRLEKTGISVNKLSPSLWKHISDCYSGADYCSAVSKGIVTQLVQLPAVKVFRLPIGGKIKRLKSNLCNVIQETTPKSKFTHQDNGQDIIKVTKNTCKTKKRTKPCVDTSFGTAQQSTLENLDHSNAQLDSNHDTLSNPVIEQSLHVRSNACTKSATPPPLDLEDFELECVLPKFVITKDNPILTGSKDSDQEVSNESNHCPERSTSPIQKSIVQCSDSTEHIEMVSTKEESIDIVEDIYEPEFVSVSEDFDQKLTPDFNITAKTEKETEFVDVGEIFDNKSTTKPCDIPLVREESHFIIVDTASQAIKTESIWDGNSFELLEARSNDSNILDKAHTDIPPTGLVNGNDAERIIDYTDTNDNIESGPLDNCDKPTFSVSSSLWQKHVGNASLPRANLLDSVLEHEINQDIPTAQKRSGAIDVQPVVPLKTRKIAPKKIPIQQLMYNATNPNNSGLQKDVITVIEGFSQPISQQRSIVAPQTKIQQDTIISFQQMEENKNLPLSLQDVSNTKYQPLHTSIFYPTVNSDYKAPTAKSDQLQTNKLCSLISASNVRPEMESIAYPHNLNTFGIRGVRTFENSPKDYVPQPIDDNYTPIVDVYQPLSDTFTESNNLNQKSLKSLHTLNNIKQPSLDNLQSPVVASVASQASTMARSSWHVVQKDCDEMLPTVLPHTLGMQITNETVNPSEDVTKASAHHLSFQKVTSSLRWDSQSQIPHSQNHVTTTVQSPLQSTTSITPSQSNLLTSPSSQSAIVTFPGQKQPLYIPIPQNINEITSVQNTSINKPTYQDSLSVTSAMNPNPYNTYSHSAVIASTHASNLSISSSQSAAISTNSSKSVLCNRRLTTPLLFSSKNDALNAIKVLFPTAVSVSLQNNKKANSISQSSIATTTTQKPQNLNTNMFIEKSLNQTYQPTVSVSPSISLPQLPTFLPQSKVSPLHLKKPLIQTVTATTSSQNVPVFSSQQMHSPLKSILKTPLNNPISKSVSSTNVASFSNLASQSEALIALPQKPSSLTPITTDIGTTVIIPSDSDNCRNIVSSQSSVETDIYRQEADDLFYNIYSSSSTISNSKSLKRVELENNPILENTMDDDNNDNDNDNDNGWESYENNFEDENQHNSNIETCGQVDVQIGDSENYEKYILRSENKIICKLCEKSFEQNEEYKSHVKLHLKASHFFCRKCKIDVPIISFLNFHLNSCMKTLPPKDLVVLSSDDEPEPTPEANYKCKVCGEKFGFRINLKYHKETHINNKAKYTFLCPLCGQAFKTKNDFRFHKSQHHNSDTNSHVCNECGQTFKLLIELELHKSEQHKQKLTCPYCPTTFSLSSSLKTHMSEHHIVNTSEVINIGD